MDDDYEKLFRVLVPLQPPRRLYFAVIRKIEGERARSVRFRLTLLIFSAAASFAGLIPAFQYLIAGFYQTDLYQYVSVIFSGGSSGLTYWKDFLLLMADSFPLTAAVMVFAALFALLGSIRGIASNLKFGPLKAGLA